MSGPFLILSRWVVNYFWKYVSLYCKLSRIYCNRTCYQFDKWFHRNGFTSYNLIASSSSSWDCTIQGSPSSSIHLTVKSLNQIKSNQIKSNQIKSNQIKSHLNILGSEGPTTDKASSQIRTASDPCRNTGRDSNLNKPRLKWQYIVLHMTLHSTD